MSAVTVNRTNGSARAQQPDQPPPAADLDAEAAVLSTALLDPQRLASVRAVLRPEHFYADANRQIYQAIVAVADRGAAVDIIAVASELRERGRLEQIGGSPYLAELSTATPAVAHVLDHARLVVGQSRARHAREIGQRLAAGSISPEAAASSLAALSEPTAPTEDAELAPLAALIGPALDRAARRRAGDEMPVPVPWPAYAEALGGGFWPGAHFITAGTAVGKSQLSLQTGLGAARSGIPVIYIGLELDEMQIALRVLGEHARMRWSDLYLGRCSADDLARARDAARALDGMPFYYDLGPPRGWPVSRLYTQVQAARAKYPTGPLLLVLDYLQLIGSDQAEFERRPELRELVGRAAYAARDVARRFDAAVVVVSSAARSHYGLLASDAKEAGLCTRKVPGLFEPIRTIAHPHVLVGLGKESGEVEFSADTVTALIRWPAPLENGARAVICAVPKVRCGIERWSAMAFDGRFTELPVRDISELPEVGKRGGRGAPVSDDDVRARVIATVRRFPNLRSANQIEERTDGTRTVTLRTIKDLRDEGIIELGSDGFAVKEPNQ